MTLTTAGVLLGVALYVAIEIINRSTLASYRDSVQSLAGKTSLTISSHWSGFPEAKIEIARGTPGVSFAVPQIHSRAHYIGGDGSTESMIVLGVDLLEDHSVWSETSGGGKIVQNALSFLNHPDSIILSQSFADQHALSIGSKIVLATTQGKQGFVVRGILPPEGISQAYGGEIAVMDIDAARLAFGKQGKTDRVDIVANEDRDIEELAQTLRSAYGQGYTVERPEGRAENLKKTLGPFQAMLTFFGSLALLVGLFLVSDSIAISVAERRKEIGTLRALGATRKMILAVFLSEASLIGVVGSTLGAGIGRLSATGLVKWVSQAASDQSRVPVQVARLAFGPKEFCLALLIGTAVSVIAALLPSIRATHIQPLDAIGHRGSAPPSRGAHVVYPWIGAALLLFLAVSTHWDLGSRSKAIGVLDQFSGLLGSILFGPWIFRRVMAMFRSPLSRLGGTLTRLSTDNLLRNPSRTASNVMSLMAGLLLVIMLSTINTSFKDSIRGRYGKAIRPDLLVSSYGNISFQDQQPLDEAVRGELAATPGASGAYGMRMIQLPYQGRQITLKAFDETDPSIHYGLFDLKDRPASEAGYELYHSDDPTVLASENFSILFGKKTGDHLVLQSPTGDVKLRIVGIQIEPSVGGGLISMSRDTYKKYWKDSLVNAFAVQVRPDADRRKVREDIERRLGESRNIGVNSQAEVSEKIDALIDKNFRYTWAIEIAALLVGFLGVLNTLIVSVMERKQELGTLRAIGMSRKQLYSIIFQEAALLGIVSSLIAIALGSWTSSVWIGHSLVSAFGWLIEFHFPWRSVLSVIGCGTLITIAASWLPARQAALLEIREALSHE